MISLKHDRKFDIYHLILENRVYVMMTLPIKYRKAVSHEYLVRGDKNQTFGTHQLSSGL